MSYLWVSAHWGVSRFIIGGLLLRRIERRSGLLHINIIFVLVEWEVLTLLLLIIIDSIVVASYRSIHSPRVLIQGVVAISCVLSCLKLVFYAQVFLGIGSLLLNLKRIIDWLGVLFNLLRNLRVVLAFSFVIVGA